MNLIERLPDGSFLVDGKRTANSFFKLVLEQGSVEQICKAIQERIKAKTVEEEAPNA